jgi:putative DNA primase/helicase
MREDLWTFMPTHTLIVATDHRPVVNSAQAASWRRLRLVPFPYEYIDEPTMPHHRRTDALLRDRLFHGAEQQEAVLAWLVQGAARSYRNGAGQRPVINWGSEVLAATDAWRQAEDVVHRFIVERADLGPDRRVKTSDLYDEYRHWCTEGGRPPGQDKNFFARIEQHPVYGALLEEIHPQGSKWYLGIDLKSRGGIGRHGF